MEQFGIALDKFAYMSGHTGKLGVIVRFELPVIIRIGDDKPQQTAERYGIDGNDEYAKIKRSHAGLTSNL
ncbi:hypothetical protein D3C85_1773540 [compost metagenome]